MVNKYLVHSQLDQSTGNSVIWKKLLISSIVNLGFIYGKTYLCNHKNQLAQHVFDKSRMMETENNKLDKTLT